MRRRDFLAFIAGSVGLSPLGVYAQHSGMPLMGFLSSRGSADSAVGLAAFRRGLSSAGYDESRNLAIEFRWAEGHYERLRSMADELVQRQPTVLVAVGGEPSALAAKAATGTIPTVFSLGGDPIKLGLAASYHRPGGNMTGITLLTSELEPKRL